MTVLTLFEKLRLLSLVDRFGIHLVSNRPGEVTVRVSSWDEHESLFTSLLDRLTAEGYVYSVEKKGDFLNISYPRDLLNDRDAIDHLLFILNEFGLY